MQRMRTHRMVVTEEGGQPARLQRMHAHDGMGMGHGAWGMGTEHRA